MPYDIVLSCSVGGTVSGTGVLNLTQTEYGTSPMMVEMLATPAAGFSGYDEYREITYVWVLDGAPITDYGYANLPTAWRNPNVKYGQRVFFYLDEPGTTYTGTCWAVSHDGAVVADATPFSITTGNPDTTYSGTDTIALDPSGTFTGKPTGAQEVTTVSGLQTALNSASSAKRVVIARGQTVEDFAITELDHLKHIGAFGTGNRPIVRPTKSYGTILNMSGASVGSPSSVDQITITDIDFRGYWDAANEIGQATDLFHMIHTSCTFGLVHNCNIQGFKLLHMHLSDTLPFRLGVARCTITHWQDYGFYAAGNSSAVYSFAESDIAQPANSPTHTNQGRYYLNNMQGPGRMGGTYAGLFFSQTSMMARGSWSPAEQACWRMNSVPTEDSEQYLDRVTAEGGGAILWNTGTGSPEKRVKGVVDKALLLASAYTGYEAFFAHCGGMDIRNTMVVVPNVPNADNVSWSSAIKLDPNGGDANNLAAPVRILGSTMLNLRNTTNDLGDTVVLHDSGGGLFTDFTSDNNVQHGPNLDNPVDGGLSTSGSIPGFAPRYGGVKPNFPLVIGTFGSSVANGGTFTVSYPSGTNQAYWTGLDAENDQHAIRVNNSAIYHADAAYGGDMSVTFGASNITITNLSGVTWSAGQAYQLRLDRHTEMTLQTSYANPATLPLYSPSSGAADTGFIPYDDFFGSPRPQVNETGKDHLGNALAASGNEAGAILSGEQVALASSDPAASELGHPLADPIVLTFSEAITLGTGNITLRRQSLAGTFSTVETFDVAATQGTSPGQINVSGATLTIYPTSPTAMRKYAVRIAPTAIASYAGIATDTALQFVTDTGRILPSKNPADYTTVIQNQTFTTQQEIDTGDDDTLFLNCTFQNITGYGLRLRNVDNVVVANCTFSNTSDSAILFRSTGSTTNCAVLDCTFTDIDGDGIQAAKIHGSSIDHTGLIISGNTLTRTGQNSTAGLRHGIYVQVTDVLVQYNQILEETDGNGVSIRAAGTVFANTVDAVSRSVDPKACIRYYGDHLAGPIGAARTDDELFVTWNTLDGNNDFDGGISIFKPASVTTTPYTDAEWFVNLVKIWGNTVTNVATTYDYDEDWPPVGYISIEQDGVEQIPQEITVSLGTMALTLGGNSTGVALAANDGFSARKATAGGSDGGVIASWDTPDWNPDNDFNATTGIWTAPKSGVVWMGAMGFPSGGTAGGTECNIDTQVGGADFNMAGRDYAGTGDAHGSSNFHAAILQVTGGAEYQTRQNGGTAEDCAFSAIYLDTSVAFSAYRSATLGTINTTVTGYTEGFDLGSDFDASTGVFTVPTTGKYLVTFHGKATNASGNSAAGFNVVVNAGTDYAYTYTISGGGLWSNSLGHSFLLDLTATDTVSITQVNELLETVRFSMALVTPTVAFAARDTAEGGAGDTMATWTEDFDLGSDFNATSGVFTAPEDGQYIVMGSGNRTNSAGEWNLSLLLNGSEYLRTRHYVTGVTAHACPARFGIVMNLATSDTLAMRQNTGATGERRFAVMKV